MKKRTKKILIISGVVLLIFLLFKRYRKKQNESGNGGINFTFTDQTPSQAFNDIKQEYQNDENKLQLLNVAERIYRLESGNFTSNIYKQTKGAGIIAVNSEYPYGWVLPVATWQEKGKPSGFYQSQNGNKYITFPNLKLGIYTVMAIIEGYYAQGYDTSRYYSTSQNDYIAKLKQFTDNKLITQSYQNNPYLESA